MRSFDIFKTLGLGLLGVSFVASTAAAQCPAVDIYEDNDDCLTATALTAGTYNNLTTFGTASAGGEDQDYYSINLPAGEILNVDCQFIDANGDVDVYLWDAAGGVCGSETTGDYLVRGFSSTDNENVSYANTSGAAMNIVVMVELFSSVAADCQDYSLTLSTMPDPCIAAIDDGQEENDTCGAAGALALGSTTGLFVSETDADYYAITVPANEILTVDMTYAAGANADPDLDLFDDAACTNSVDSDDGDTGAAQVTWPNTTGVAATVYLQVDVPAGEGCNNYDLNAVSIPDPCAGPDDSFEDNDDCTTAIPMADGTYTGLFANDADEDFFEVTVADGDTLTVDIFFTDTLGDMDLELFLDEANCIADTNEVASTSTSDDESISYTNTTGSTLTMIVHVYHWTGDSASDCNTYDMVITGSGGSVATPSCAGDGSVSACPCGNESTLGAEEGCNNSLGFGAKISASGSASVANDDLVFTITQGVPNQPSLLVQGASVTMVPFKDGLLCAGNPTERVEVVGLDASGMGSTTSSIVTNGNVSPGDTRNYQFWYRNPGGVSPCGSGSNFSAGATVVWQ